MGYSMRTDRYRLTVWVDRKDHQQVDAVELYDHQADPQENTNLAKQPANAALVDRLMQQWQQGWQGSVPSSSAAPAGSPDQGHSRSWRPPAVFPERALAISAALRQMSSSTEPGRMQTADWLGLQQSPDD